MPRKIRELVRDFERAGFVNRGGKGSHRKFQHTGTAAAVGLSGQAGTDARPYQERDVRAALESLSKTK